MISPPRSALRRTPAAVLIAALVALIALVGPTSSAAAHDELVSSEPAADAVLDALPGQLTLIFSAELLDGGGNEMQVTDAAGISLADGVAVVDGTTLVQPLTGTASGPVTVLWRAVSSDGHPISGEFAFAVDAAPAPTETATGGPVETATPTPTASAPVQTSTPSPTTAPDAGTGGAGALVWIILGIVVVAAGAAVVYLLVSRARRGARGDSGPGTDR